AASDDAPQNDSVAIAHKKVIKPLDAEPKPDLNALLAAEEAHTAIPTADEVIAGTVPASAPTAPSGAAEEAAVPPAPSGSVVTPTQPATPPQPGTGFDPNNIAL